MTVILLVLTIHLSGGGVAVLQHPEHYTSSTLCAERAVELGNRLVQHNFIDKVAFECARVERG